MEELDNYKNWLHKKSTLNAVKYNELAQRELCAKEVYIQCTENCNCKKKEREGLLRT